MIKFIFSALILFLLPTFVSAVHAGVPHVIPSIKNPLSATTTEALINVVINLLVIVALPLVILLILYAGFQLMFAGASPDQRNNAINVVKYALIGYGVILLAKVLVAVITGLT